MNRFKALYINEMIKISHKYIVIIVLGIMVLGIFGYGGIMKVSERSTYVEVDRGPGETQKDWILEEMEYRINDFKSMISESEEALKKEPSEDEKANILNSIKKLKIQIEVYEFALDQKIYIDGAGFKANSLRLLIDAKIQLSFYADTPEEELTEFGLNEFNNLKENVVKYENIVKNSDYKLFMELSDELIKNDASLTDEEKQIKLQSNALRLKIDPKGEFGSDSNYYDPLSSYLTSIERIKSSLLHNVDYTSYETKPLTPRGRTELENQLAVETYKLENENFDKVPSYSTEYRELAITGMLSFGNFMLICLVLILAGGAISQEISTGSIKSLIIAPVKRYKIYFAKFASLLTAGVIGAIVLYITSMLAHGIFFGFTGGADYIYAVNGVAHELNFYVYRLAFIGVSFIDVIVYMVLAFMLSTITRNTAASVGISIATYFGGNLVNLFLSSMNVLTGEWTKFIPFNNISLATRIFKDSQGFGMSDILGLNQNAPSLIFSLSYLLVMIICFTYIGLDSFNRRDIK